MDNETNVLIEDGATDLRFGDKTVTVKALKIAASVQWSKRVKRAVFEQARLALSSVEDAKNLATESEKVDAFIERLNGTVGEEFLAVRDLLIEHSPHVLTADVVNEGTSQQIVVAFKRLFENENPTELLTAVMRRT